MERGEVASMNSSGIWAALAADTEAAVGRPAARRRLYPLASCLPSRAGWWLLFELSLKKLPPVREALGLK